MNKPSERANLLSLAAAALSMCTMLHAPTAEAQAPGNVRGRPPLDVRATTASDTDDTVPVPPPSPAIPADDTAQEPDGVEPGSTTGDGGIRGDGDLADGGRPLLRDGIVEVGEPEARADGTNRPAVDTRPAAETRVSENPPPPGDPLLYQIEELEPILDRRPRQLFRFEPYDPVGVKAGSLVLFPELETSGAFQSNTFRSPHARSDVALDVRPSARLVSNWTRHALEFRASGLLTYFNEFPSEDDRAYTIEARGRVDITRRTSLQLGLSRDFAQESRSAPDGRSGGTRADVTTDRALAALSHRFNRLSVLLRGSVTDIAYGSTVNAGVPTDNSRRNYQTTEEAVRASWELKPTLAAFGEIAVNQRDYEQRDALGIDRSSRGERYRVGLSFAGGATAGVPDRPSPPLLSGEVSIGYGEQRPGSRLLPDVTGVILDSTVTWRPSALTAIAFNARSDFGETETAGVGGIRSQSSGVDVRHELRRQLIATAGIGATFSDYQGSTQHETETRLTAGLEYFLSREAILFGRYTHTTLESTAPATSYTNDEVRIGMRVRQ